MRPALDDRRSFHLVNLSGHQQSFRSATPSEKKPIDPVPLFALRFQVMVVPGLAVFDRYSEAVLTYSLRGLSLPLISAARAERAKPMRCGE